MRELAMCFLGEVQGEQPVQCKGPEVGTCSESSRKGSVAKAEEMKEGLAGDDVRSHRTL